MKRHLTAMLAVTVLSVATVLPAWAEGRHEGRDDGRQGYRHGVRGWEGERDIRHFENRHLSIWRGGGWRHGSHEGRIGWWWVIGGMWYFYPQPVYPYPDPYIPPVVVVQSAPEQTPPAAPTAQVWYYCEASKSYYPYVASCPAGWKTVPATPPPAPPN